MPALCAPPRLYMLCLDRLIPRYEKLGCHYDCDDPHAKGPLDNLARKLVEDLLVRAFNNANGAKIALEGTGNWNYDWQIFFTPKIQSAIVIWNHDLLKFAAAKCQSLRRVLVARWKTFSPDSLSWLPPTLLTLDFDGELFYRGWRGPALQRVSGNPGRWLPEAEALFRALHVLRQKSLQPDILKGAGSTLAEVHLGNLQGVTAADLRAILEQHPNLQVLRHYQLVTALYQLHADQWRKRDNLPRYKLKNLDVDFSHVIRCRMSPEAVLASDALHLAVLVCPDASAVRVRFDCSTSHDVLVPLVSLRRLRELSVVCVSSGERTLLDFSDMVPILEQHGPSYMTSLELKVIEEVDVHAILTFCTKLERLVLSGCGNVTPHSCASYKCSSLTLRRLRLLFYADGDDFSWDHALPQCFWPATLGTGAARGKQDSSSHKSRLEGIFLESPRISSATAAELFHRTPGTKMFPDLQVLSLCRYPELTFADLSAICGANFPRVKTGLRYVRVSQCEQIGVREERRLRNMLRECRIRDTIVLTTQ